MLAAAASPTSGTLTVTASTLSGNSAGGSGGGIFNGGTLTVTASTFTANSARGGGADIYNSAVLVRGESSLRRASSPTRGRQPRRRRRPAFVSGGHNLFSDTPAVALDPTDLVNTDPLLGPLADNGGPTFTHALLPGSPAIDAGVGRRRG